MTTEKEILKFATEQWGEKDDAGIGLKLAEETGEVAGALLKIPEGRATEIDLRKEMGDVLIVLSQIAARHDWTLESIRTDRYEQVRQRAENVPCAACDRGDHQLGHARECKYNTEGRHG